LGKALNCTINTTSKFDRKHYSYPDLPKGYQISQYDQPFCIDGKLEIQNSKSEMKSFRIRRIHLEEDTGKLIHSGGDSLIDFNRSGVPLVELVTEPDFNNSDDVKTFLQELYTIIKYLDISDADMEKGSMRMEPNISVRLTGETKLPSYKVEVKNINSFRYVKQAIDYEFKRQSEMLEKGEIPVQETRGFDEKKVSTYSQRVKEDAADYRYFPEPDIPPIIFSDEEIKNYESQIPELPQEKVKRYVKEFSIKDSDAFIITRDKKIAEYFEKVVAYGKKLGLTPQFIANLIINKKILTNIPEEKFADLAYQSSQIYVDDPKLPEIVDNVIKVNSKIVQDYRNGKVTALQGLIGPVMREMQGKADARRIIEILKEKLEQIINGS
ncbi:MAG TPA: Asp-tRNA(Asn)/Glu-tRNA(Gln) amidotransferase subunit GatB, partial [Candidatus Nitrosocosmicus sp.]|nr:Asp-tRNA(Asn)/Glu-tRNA(Gln) amidotransferase subunit GatB [Candidatus Nitrosocosmicus sp.]